ncbi:unnamed protein product [Acanthoscelides obtectus]|uniref:Integrase catalytic domain-containing protein n=1 Tax=Acanthoscelides obtectus TaxID=200917 RepID=A0A9P0M9A5_ACAOB|nr:unnamed protein product [Acanthoscelides obtectus]CAK1663846.1 Pro-Pol polyprotein [Acanthoscelides obtectus]
MITTGNKVGAVNDVSLKIRLGKDIVVYRTPYRLAANKKDELLYHKQGFIRSVRIPKEPFHTLYMDCLGPLPASTDGYKHALVVVDAFTKYCILTPMKSVTTAEAREKLHNVLVLFGTPKRIIMDAATSFKNTTFPKYLDRWASSTIL